MTIVKDATAAFRWEQWSATIEVNGPTFAHAIQSTAEAIASLRASTTAWSEAARGEVQAAQSCDNPARELYARLGFVTVRRDEIYTRMEWTES